MTGDSSMTGAGTTNDAPSDDVKPDTAPPGNAPPGNAPPETALPGGAAADSLAARLLIVEGDITRLAVDAIVNAANHTLLGGGGVDGAIHRAAGRGLLAECRTLGGCPTGQARLTAGYNLPARHVIHTVGPVYRDGRSGEPELLRSCYLESLRLAAETGLATIAFPAISTGVYGYPKEAACALAVAAVTEWLAGHDLPRTVTFCCFDRRDADLYRARLRALADGA